MMPRFILLLLLQIMSLFLMVPRCQAQQPSSSSEATMPSTSTSSSSSSSSLFVQDDNETLLKCPLQVYLPFTIARTRDYAATTNYGYSQLAATVLAMQHFNQRNGTIVTALDNINNCRVQLDFNRTLVFDSGLVGHQAGMAFQQQHHQNQQALPCAIVGTMNDFPALELSTLAVTSGRPFVVHQALNPRVSDPAFSPNSVQMFPDLSQFAKVFWEYMSLLHQRTNYISFVYALSDNGLPKLQAMDAVLEQAGVHWNAHPYLEQARAVHIPKRSIHHALLDVKNTGHRTIVVAMESPFDEIYEIAQAAHDLGMTNGQYLWLWFGNFVFLHVTEALTNPLLQDLLRGSVWMANLDPFWIAEYERGGDAFLNAWKDQGPSFVDLVNSYNPVAPGQVGYQDANASFFQHYTPEYASSFAYDATMAVGLAACEATAALPPNTSLSVDGFVQALQGLSFQGASGWVEFGQNRSGYRNQARYGPLVLWAGYNFLPPMLTTNSNDTKWTASVDPTRPIWTPDFRLPGQPWKRVDNSHFYYADGRTVPPDLLRDESFESYLPQGVKILGATLLVVALFFAVGSALWVYMHRQHPVLVAAQPPFLYCLCLGATILSLTIIPLSMDEGSEWDSDQLDKACMAIPWLFTTGYVITYSALFTKLWRVNKVLQFTRRANVSIRNVAWPSAALLLAALIVLILWTILDGVQWVRIEVDDLSGATAGRCQSDNIFIFVVPLVVIMLIPSILAGFMAWKTKDVDDAYSESTWIFVMVLMQLEVILFAMPTFIILNEQSTTTNYVGILLICWIFPMSSLGLVMTPKFIAYNRAVRGRRTPSTIPRGSGGTGQVHITGLALPGPNRTRQGGGPSDPSHISIKQVSVNSEIMAAAHLTMRQAPATAAVADPTVSGSSDMAIRGGEMPQATETVQTNS